MSDLGRRNFSGACRGKSVLQKCQERVSSKKCQEKVSDKSVK